MKPFGPSRDACFIPRLALPKQFLPQLYKPWVVSASSHLHSSTVALGSFSLALASSHSHCATLLIASFDQWRSWRAVVHLERLPPPV
jgi:hypothetical protein